eukprot:TRINITY_DN7448_c0_g1_i1.p1 TRINITY_DN7448_c0_g1~~TRINITY_DN7448_c0_g1_i1.p1  ORF type:complete len:680 (+),score=227.37 TRINITY_DN7448_c0_g1_i1:43-2040(+)
MALQPEDLEVTVQRRPGEHLGLNFRGEEDLQLVQAVSGSPSDRAGCGRMLGRTLTHVGGRPVTTCADVRSDEEQASIQLRFSWKVGEPLEVRRTDGSYTPCAVKQVSGGYVLAGSDGARLFEKRIPFADSLRFLRPATADAAYVAGQPAEVRRTGGVWKRCVVKAVDDAAKRYVVCGADDGRVFEKQVPFTRAADFLRPVDVPDGVVVRDRRTQKTLVFQRSATGAGIEYKVDGEPRPNVTRIEYIPPDVGRPSRGGGELRFPDIQRGASLPQDADAVAKLRLLCEACGCAHNLPREVVYPPAPAADAPLPDSPLQLDIVPPPALVAPVLAAQEALFQSESWERRGLAAREGAARRHVAKLRKTGLAASGQAVSLGLRCGADGPPVVAEAAAGSASAAAGLTKGDHILSVATPSGLHRVYSRGQLMKALSPASRVVPGVTVVFTVCRGRPQLAREWAAALAGVPLDSLGPLPPGVSLPQPPADCVVEVPVMCSGVSRRWQEQVAGMIREVSHFFASSPGLNVSMLMQLKTDPVAAERLVRDAAAACGVRSTLTAAEFVEVYADLCRAAGMALPEGADADPYTPATCMSPDVALHFDAAGEQTVRGMAVALSFEAGGNPSPVLDAFAEIAAAGLATPPTCTLDEAVAELRGLLLERVYAAQEQGFA